jgi:integrase
MAKTKYQNRHLWKHNESGVWYYQRTYKGKRHKFTLDTRDVNNARIERDKYDLMIAVHGDIAHVSDEYIESPVFGQVCINWFDVKKSTCRPDTIIDGYKPKLNAHIMKAPFVSRPIDLIEPSDIEDWWHSIPCKGSTINVILDIMSNIYKFAMKKKWVNYNPVKLIDRPKRDLDLPDPFHLDEVEILLENIDEHYFDYQTVRFSAGMRASEQNALERSDIDLRNRLIKVRRSVVGGRIGKTKNKWSKRNIKMKESTYQAILRQVKRAFEQGSQTLFFNKQGNRIDARDYNRAVWRPLFEKKEIKESIRYRHCRCSRHTYISLSLAKGENPMFIAKQVGHRDARTIFKHYAAYIKNDYDGSKFDAQLTQVLHKVRNQKNEKPINTLKSY